jgi:hypothetical protein
MRRHRLILHSHACLCPAFDAKRRQAGLDCRCIEVVDKKKLVSLALILFASLEVYSNQTLKSAGYQRAYRLREFSARSSVLAKAAESDFEIG